MIDKTEQDWNDLLDGKSVPDADPKTIRKARSFRNALLSQVDDEDLPYPHILENALSRLKDDPEFPHRGAVKKVLFGLRLKIWFSKLKQSITRWILIITKPPVVLPAFATVLVLAIVIKLLCPIICDFPPAEKAIGISDLINISYNEVDVQYWENRSSDKFVLRFSESARPSLALQAFNAGLWKGRESLLSSSSKVMEKNWTETEWVSYYELGRWTLLLESVCRSLPQYQVPNDFWDRQKNIFNKLNQDILARKEKSDDLEGVTINWVSSQFASIGPLLEQLPNELPLSTQLAAKLKFMRDGLIID